LIAYLRNRRILKLTVLRAAIIAGNEWEAAHGVAVSAMNVEQKAAAKKAAVELAEAEAELEFLTKS